MENQMRTWKLKYEVIGKICPHGMTAENCHLRKVLDDWQKKFSLGGSIYGFAYKILENGNLLVPSFYYPNGNETMEDKKFDLKKIINSTCNGSCYFESREKEKANPEEFRKLPKMQTVIQAYDLSAANCPMQMCSANCPLRKKLSEIEETNHIGYRAFGNILVMPREHYNSPDNVYRDISKTDSEICSMCFEKNRGQR